MPERLRDPVAWTSALQLAKTALAAALAWVIAHTLFDVAQPFLAPWAALLTVHATVFGTLRSGVQQVAATVVGVLVAFAAGHLLGVTALSLGIAVLIGLAAGSVRGLRSEATTGAATAIVVLTTGYADDGGMLAARLLDVAIGVAVGLLVNLLVWPPLRDRSAAHQIDVIDDRIGDLLCEIAGGLRAGRPDTDEWIERTEALDEEIDEGRRVLGQARESGRLNPRPAKRRRMRATQDFAGVLHRLGQAVAETRSMARTVALAPAQEWDQRWLELLRRTGEAVSDADAERLAAVRAELDELVELGPDGRNWPVYGALIVNLRNILESLDAVATVQPVEVPTRPPASPSREARRTAPSRG
jgi:uncharacterized membrane protein YgaE (UPF0421/DUF939 family)